jgi:hypothetical protein
LDFVKSRFMSDNGSENGPHPGPGSEEPGPDNINVTEPSNQSDVSGVEV